MKNQHFADQAKHGPIFSRPAASRDGTIHLHDSRVHDSRADELVRFPGNIPGEEIIDPKLIEPIGVNKNNESPANVDGAQPSPGDIDDAQAGDDEDTLQPITQQSR